MMMARKFKVMFYVTLLSIVLKIVQSKDLSRPIIEVHQGKLRGVEQLTVNGNNYFAFRGIPYAKPPIGELRFKDPEPAEEWSGEREAKKFGNTCPFSYKALMGKEDCLFLNVYTTTLTPDVPRAVIVSIHGGSFFLGSGNDQLFGPDFLIEKDVILVTINYRLGILGFLNLDEEEASGNQGLKDQVMALKWVQQNIDKFGGDPNNVTIAGESAGSAAVHYLTLSPLAEGLFHKAILQSGVATNPWASTSAESIIRESEKIAEKLGNKVSDTKQILEYFKSVDLDKLINASQPPMAMTNMSELKLPFVPSIDSKSKNPFLGIPVEEAAKSGIKVPHIIGYTSHEIIALFAVAEDEQYSIINDNQDTFFPFPSEKKFLQDRNVSLKDINEFFMGSKKIAKENAQALTALLSARFFIINIHDTLETQLSVSDIPAYLYKFDYYSKETSLLRKFLHTDLEGTSHAEDLLYMFFPKILKMMGIKPPAPGTTEHDIQQRFVELWTNFAKTGIPNSKVSELIPVIWEPVDNPTEYKCLKISEDLSLINESNILHKIKSSQNKNLNVMMERKFKVMFYVTFLSIVLKIVQGQDLSVNSTVSRPIVQVHEGKVRGIAETNVNGNNYFAFRGIPYAKPPIGELRFKDPEPAEEWSGEREGKEFGNVCPSYGFSKMVMGNEDCLYLNVYTTELNPDEKRAVMVWIHGGAFVLGSGNDDTYGPDYLLEKDVVVVTINYRLGVFGFLNLDDEEAPGNQGLKDQVMALKWVQQNIDKFGGDPNRVTIFGESAGGAAVHYLTLSPLAQGLFHRAILQSGVATNPWASVSTSMKEEAQKIAGKLGSEISDTKQLIEYFKTVDTKSLLEAEESFRSWKNFYEIKFPFVPSVDSKSKDPFLSIPVQEAAKSGIKVPHIIGHTSHEGIIFIAGLQDDNYAEIEADDTLVLHPNQRKILQHLNISVADVKKFFMGNKEVKRENDKQFVDLVSAGLFLMNIHDTVEIQTSIPGVPTYFYKFDHSSGNISAVKKMFKTDLEGTSHADDLSYLFLAKSAEELGIKPPALGSTDYIVKERFVELWTNFAKTGNPNSKASELIPIEWQPVDSSTEYKCLKISKDLSLIKESNILQKISKSPHKKNLSSLLSFYVDSLIHLLDDFKSKLTN
ncbi:uncharacterized protein LOC130674421 [Microplitis mediator]|uniref:uncharacterized protein LOC130674421 n=1 Tax=Microplitis mediator TaxID=375433 RepID=UPI0025550293|nr:uncharacterized protein LOC130674421 [Microplitis mediator]